MEHSDSEDINFQYGAYDEAPSQSPRSHDAWPLGGPGDASGTSGGGGGGGLWDPPDVNELPSFRLFPGQVGGVTTGMTQSGSGSSLDSNVSVATVIHQPQGLPQPGNSGSSLGSRSSSRSSLQSSLHGAAPSLVGGGGVGGNVFSGISLSQSPSNIGGVASAGTEVASSRTLLVSGNLSAVGVPALHSLFSSFGEVRSFYAENKNDGHVLVTFCDVRKAGAAKDGMSGIKLAAAPVRVVCVQPHLNPLEINKHQGVVAVSAAPDSVVSLGLAEVTTLLGDFGDICSCNTGFNGGFQVEFFDVRDADAAVKRISRGPLAGGARLSASLVQPITPPLSPPPDQRIGGLHLPPQKTGLPLQRLGLGGSSRSTSSLFGHQQQQQQQQQPQQQQHLQGGGAVGFGGLGMGPRSSSRSSTSLLTVPRAMSVGSSSVDREEIPSPDGALSRSQSTSFGSLPGLSKLPGQQQHQQFALQQQLPTADPQAYYLAQQQLAYASLMQAETLQLNQQLQQQLQQQQQQQQQMQHQLQQQQQIQQQQQQQQQQQLTQKPASEPLEYTSPAPPQGVPTVSSPGQTRPPHHSRPSAAGAGAGAGAAAGPAAGAGGDRGAERSGGERGGGERGGTLPTHHQNSRGARASESSGQRQSAPPHHHQLHHQQHGQQGRGRSDDNSEVVIARIKAGQEVRTTLMVRNIPNKYTQKMLLQTLDETHLGQYDFFYLPIDFKNKCNVGYAFLNLIDPQAIVTLYERFAGKRWPKFNSQKICEITFARLQGKDSLIHHFQNSSLLNEDKRLRPVLYHSSGPLRGEPQEWPEPEA